MTTYGYTSVKSKTKTPGPERAADPEILPGDPPLLLLAYPRPGVCGGYDPGDLCPLFRFPERVCASRENQE